MKDLRRSWHCRRLFFRYLRQKDKEKLSQKQLTTPPAGSKPNPQFDKFNTAISSTIVATLFLGIISIFIHYYAVIAIFGALLLEILIAVIGAVWYGHKERKQNRTSENRPDNQNTSPPPPKRKISKYVIIVMGIALALIVTLVTINAVSCSNNRKITIESKNVTTQTNTITFSATAKRNKAEEYKTVNVILNVYGKDNKKIYCDYQLVSFWTNTISVPINFKIEKYLVSAYNNYDFEVVTKTPNLPKPQNSHRFSNIASIEQATCTEYGIKYIKCSHCDILKPEKISPLGHNFIVFSQTKATCTTDGKITHKCSRCFQTKTETTKATGHRWGTSSCLNCGTKMQSFCFEVTATLKRNGGVGNQWSQEYSYENSKIGNGSILTLPPGETIKIKALVIEHDDYSDVGVAWIEVKLEKDFSITEEVVVTENRGKYAGSKAYWDVTIKVTKV